MLYFKMLQLKCIKSFFLVGEGEEGYLVPLEEQDHN